MTTGTSTIRSSVDIAAPSVRTGMGQTGALIAFRADRLGARLISLMNAMRLSDDLGAPFRCAWSESAGVGQTFNDPTELFEADFVDRHFLAADEWSVIRPEAERLTAKLQQAPEVLKNKLSSGQHVIVGNAFGVIELAGEEPAQVVARFRAQLSRIPFAAPVCTALDGLSSKLSGYTAYHIRRGDLTDDPKAKHKAWPHKVVPNEFYELHMRDTLASAAGQGGALLFSDDTASISHYQGLFPQLDCLASVADLDGLTEAQRDLVELIAMSFCQTIIAPDQSAFSSTAADLSGAKKVPVAEAMTSDQQDEAYTALYNRLRDRPGSFGGDGHIGQALAHIRPWLERKGRVSEAAELFGARVADGLAISFVYPATMRLHTLNDTPHSVLETAKHMAKRPPIHIADLSAAEFLHGYAHLQLGDQQTAVAHILNGFWHSPSGALARIIVPYMLESDALTPDVFLPVSRLQRALNRRRGPARRLQAEFPVLCAGQDQPIEALPSLETAVWDWAPLMRAVSFKALQRQAAIEGQRTLVEQAKVPQADVAERDSLLAVLVAFEGDPQRSIKQLKKLSRRRDADAMVWQRLSHAHWIARDFPGAAEAAGEALLREPDWPMLQVWLAMVYLRVRHYEEAAQLLSEVKLDGLPSLHALRAEAARRVGQPEVALHEIKEATALAPLQADYAMVAATLLSEANATDQAVAHLQRLVYAQRAPGKLLSQLIELQLSSGDLDGARMTAELALTRAPDKGPLESLAKEVLAQTS